MLGWKLWLHACQAGTAMPLPLFLTLFCVHWCFARMCVCVRMLHLLELNLQTVVSSPGPLEEQPVLLLNEPLRWRFCYCTS